MPDHVPPGAPPAGSMCVIPPLLKDLSRALVTGSDAAGKASLMPGQGAVDSALPGADLLNGVIAVEQTLEHRLRDAYDSLRAMSSAVDAGLATVSGQDEANAAAVCRVNDR